MSKEFLRRMPLFADVPEDDLDRIYGMAATRSLEAGQILIEEGTPGDALYIVLDGEFEVTKRADKGEIVLDIRKPGEVVGEYSLLAKVPRSASMRATKKSQVLEISQFAFDQLLSCSRTAGPAIMSTMAQRLQTTQALVAQQEKLASLGRQAAGLAHELNNPAAAVRRSADQLRDVLAEYRKLSIEIDFLALTPQQLKKLDAMRLEMEDCSAMPSHLDPLTRSDREGELQDWLDSRDVENGWELAPVLVAHGWTTGKLEGLTEHFAGPQLPVVIAWMASGCQSSALLDEVARSAERISEIVKAVKSYTFMDQAPIQQVDVHDGLDNTLIMLRHKLKSDVTVKRDYAPDLPRIEAYGSELNQVWTNIIDNAVDAMGGQGEILIRTYKKSNDRIVVEITDNGPGIPPEVQKHIFEQFYTTKEPGQGTGLGLYISHNIITLRHKGRIEIESKPEETTFRVTLPLQLEREQG